MEGRRIHNQIYIMRYILTKKKNAREILAGNYPWNQFQQLGCYWMNIGSTRRLEGSESDQVVNMYDENTEGIRPTDRHCKLDT